MSVETLVAWLDKQIDHQDIPLGESAEFLRKVIRGLTEEFKCAQFLDGRPEMEFWVRTLARRNTSFRLQTSKDWFYPDFLCQLTGGRVMAVEYKGKYLYDAADAKEKRAVGAVRQSRSGDRCLFVMPGGYPIRGAAPGRFARQRGWC